MTKKIRTIEDMAKADIMLYMTPIPEYNFKGNSLEDAVRKAKALHLGARDAIFDKVAAQIKSGIKA